MDRPTCLNLVEELAILELSFPVAFFEPTFGSGRNPHLNMFH